jgi:hypothetical protein
MNTGENSLRSGLAWTSDGVLLCSSPVIASRRDAGWSSCSSGLVGAVGSEAGWPAWWALAIADGVGCRCLLLVDLQLPCPLDASVAMTEVTDASLSEVCIFILLLLGGARTNGRWRCCGERWFDSARFTVGGSHTQCIKYIHTSAFQNIHKCSLHWIWNMSQLYKQQYIISCHNNNKHNKFKQHTSK